MSFIHVNSVNSQMDSSRNGKGGRSAGSRARAPGAGSGCCVIMCNYPAARRGDESSSAALFPAFPNDPAQHLLSEYSMQMMQLESPLADCFPRHQSVVFSPRLIHCLLRCFSPPSPLPDPIKASRQSRLGGREDTLETLRNPRQGWHWVQVTPACRSPEQGW